MSTQPTLDIFGPRPAPAVWHMLMPNMATACGRCTMWDCTECGDRIARDHTWVTSSADTTCPDCLAVDIPAEIARMQARQAVAS